MTIFEISDYLQERGFTLENTLSKFTLKDTRLYFKYYDAGFCSLVDGNFTPNMIKPATEYNSNYYTSFYTTPRYDNSQIKYKDVTVAILEEFCNDFIESYNDTVEYNKQQKELKKLDKISEDF